MIPPVATRGLAGAATLGLDARPTRVVALAEPLRALAESLPTHGSALWPAEPPRWRGIPDGNRGAVLPGISAELDGRTYHLSVKGVGAQTPLYGDAPHEGGALGGRSLYAESWFGEAPWGGQGFVGPETAVELTAMAGGPRFRGFHLCPTLALVAIPEDLVREAASRYWYRRFRGPFLQEHRLVPSNVRVYQQSDLTLGGDPESVLDVFGVRDRESLDAFLDRYVASGMAALTLYARTLREGALGLQGLVYVHVWLDKDSVVAPDGTLHFADLEGLDWAWSNEAYPLEKHVTRQFEENWYEMASGMDALIRIAERREGLRRTAAERRRHAALRLELALADDPAIRVERRADGLDLVVIPPVAPEKAVRIPAIDTGG